LVKKLHSDNLKNIFDKHVQKEKKKGVNINIEKYNRKRVGMIPIIQKMQTEPRVAEFNPKKVDLNYAPTPKQKQVITQKIQFLPSPKLENIAVPPLKDILNSESKTERLDLRKIHSERSERKRHLDKPLNSCKNANTGFSKFDPNIFRE
jgi:hypothetical protein